MASLAATFGRGAMTNGWVDIKNADVVFVMGGNPAENHPCGFKWAIEARSAVTRRSSRRPALHAHGGRRRPLLADPRRHRHRVPRTASSGTRSRRSRYHADYVKAHTNAPYVIGEKYGFNDGLFTGFDTAKGRTTRRPGPTRPTRSRRATSSTRRSRIRAASSSSSRSTSTATRPRWSRGSAACPPRRSSRWPRWSPRPGTPQKVGTILYALGWTQHSDRRPDHPHRRDAPAAPRERRAARRRRERAARPLEHPGRDRHGRHIGHPARLPPRSPVPPRRTSRSTSRPSPRRR